METRHCQREQRIRMTMTKTHLLLAHLLVLVGVQVPHRNLALIRDGSKHCAGVRRPCDVTHWRAQIEGHDGGRVAVVPQLHGPVRGARQEHARVEGVPPQRVDGHVVALIRGHVLPCVIQAALVDLTLLSTH